MLKEVQVVMLPTKNVSSIYTHIDAENRHKLLFAKELIRQHKLFRQRKESTCYNLYFLSDEEMKEEDWVYESSLSEDKVFQIVKRNNELCFFRFTNVPIWLKTRPHSAKKIIATTDSSLKVLKNYETSNSATEELVSLSICSQSFIQRYIERYNTGKTIEKVMVEYPDSNASGGTWNEITPKLRSNEIIIHPLKDTFTREECYKLFKENTERLTN